MAEEEINQIKEEKKEELDVDAKQKKKTQFVLRVVAVALAVFTLIGLALVKISVPTFPWIWVVIIGGFLLLSSLAMFFVMSVIDKLRSGKRVMDLGKLPKPATLTELRTIASKALTNDHYANHVKQCLGEKFFTVGKMNKNIVYVYKCKALYTEGMEKGLIYILINCHYPEDRRSILIDPNINELSRSIQALGTDPEDEPNVEEVTTHSPITGVTQTSRKITHEKEKKKEETKKEEESLE